MVYMVYTQGKGLNTKSLFYKTWLLMLYRFWKLVLLQFPKNGPQRKSQLGIKVLYTRLKFEVSGQQSLGTLKVRSVESFTVPLKGTNLLYRIWYSSYFSVIMIANTYYAGHLNRCFTLSELVVHHCIKVRYSFKFQFLFWEKETQNLFIITQLKRRKTGFEPKHCEHKIFTLGTFFFLGFLMNMVYPGQQTDIYSKTP